MDYPTLILDIVFIGLFFLFILAIFSINTSSTKRKIKKLTSFYKKGIDVYTIPSEDYCSYYTITEVKKYDKETPDYDFLVINRVASYMEEEKYTSRRNLVLLDIPKEIERVILNESIQIKEKEKKREALEKNNLEIIEQRKKQGLVY